MALLNSAHGYGALTKLCHWAIAGLFALQYVSATVMMRTPPEGATLGFGQAALYNWHKSIGLVALAITVLRLVNRRVGELPPWAATISPLEQKVIHQAERMLYAAMLVMPISGFVYVMAGGYGVRLFGVADLPNPIGTAPGLAAAAKWTHVAAAFSLLLPLGAHLGIVLGHHFGLRDGLISRMLPGRSRDRSIT